MASTLLSVAGRSLEECDGRSQAFPAAARFVERNLAERVPDFSMPAFVQQLTARKDEVNEEIFDTLLYGRGRSFAL